MSKTLMLFLLLSPITLFCQTGAIRGQVIDARTGDALVGANVIIVGSKPGHGAATDLNGMFLMTKIQPGEYVLRASYIDYKTATQQNVKVAVGQTTDANFSMRGEGESEPVVGQEEAVATVAEDTAKQNPGDANEPRPMESSLESPRQ